MKFPKEFKKYLILIKTAWLRQLVYRTTIYAYRFGNIFDILFQMAIWMAVYKSTEVVYGYTYHQMLTYIMISWLINFFISNFGVEDTIARNIQNGELSIYLVRPLSYLKAITAFSIGRASMSIISGAIMQIGVIAVFHNHVLPPSSIWAIVEIIFIVLISYFVRLELSMLLGMLALWIIEISGILHISNVIIRLLSGGYAPLSLLPAAVYQACLFFPFAYIIFLPTQLYLGKISLLQGFYGILIELAWLAVLYVIIKIVWRKGLRQYEAVGI
ncbi:MAG: ABC-2 family transporter protein [Candidatus Falkowbacteria bacterium]